MILIGVSSLLLIAALVFFFMPRGGPDKKELTQIDQANNRLQEVIDSQQKSSPGSTEPPKDFERTNRKGAVSVDGTK